jgi:hypothetical protein
MLTAQCGLVITCSGVLSMMSLSTDHTGTGCNAGPNQSQMRPRLPGAPVCSAPRVLSNSALVAFFGKAQRRVNREWTSAQMSTPSHRAAAQTSTLGPTRVWQRKPSSRGVLREPASRHAAYVPTAAKAPGAQPADLPKRQVGLLCCLHSLQAVGCDLRESTFSAVSRGAVNACWACQPK